MKLQSNRVGKKIYACWQGKNVGGTLGVPYEGETGPLNLTFYDPVPDQPLPNDDLDLQLVWLHHLINNQSQKVTPDTFAAAWRNHVQFPWDEYGVTLRNQHYGLKGAALGSTDNYFGEGMGAAIRSEIWACLSPGKPERAAAFAWCDAVVDHSGDGVWAEVFFAAIESAAFTETNKFVLIETGLKFLPEESRICHAVRDTMAWWETSKHWEPVREQIVTRYGGGNFTHVVPNVAITILGLLAGKDFGDAICIAVNCGMDTDCTGATLGSILGIIDPESIPQHWLDPIGLDVVISDPIEGIRPPRDLSELTEWTLNLSDQVKNFEPEFGQVAPYAPPSSQHPSRCIEFKMGFAPESVLDASWSPASALDQHRIAYGHWIRFIPAEFKNQVLIMETEIDIPKTGTTRLMAYYEPGITTWLDGEKINHFEKATAPRPYYIAPSFHRDGGSGVALEEVSPGQHTLAVALQKPETQPADLVIGLGDETTHMWHPVAFGHASRK